ncbi:hypothetical protein Zmor_000798 [Zophobas morio]|uniref:Protein TsetseEP domain-containing protein n=1 Tax=Zophobas morio TaxID=2755281 RepID=A0AA38IX00_9CUCU|nr:hypothetical protein Zmor_000798 [Zophobas morio]
MFRNVIFIVVASVLATHLSDANAVKIKSKATKIAPASLYDDALAKLVELKEIVNSAIQTGDKELDDDQKESTNYAEQQSDKAQVEIGDEANKIDGYVQDMVNLVEGAGLNPAQCLAPYQPQINQIKSDALLDLSNCITNVAKEVTQVYNDGVRDIHSTNDKVAQDEAQLAQCRSTQSILCVSPVVRQIDADKIELRETIETVVHKTTALIETVTNKVDGCTSSSVTNFETKGNAALSVLQDCFNNM